MLRIRVEGIGKGVEVKAQMKMLAKRLAFKYLQTDIKLIFNQSTTCIWL